MKLLLSIVAILLIVIGILGVISPSEFKIEREILVQKTEQEIFQSIKFLKEHEKWNAWSRKEPNLQKNFTGEDGKVGFKSSWDSPNPELGTAVQEIIAIEENKRLDTIIKFEKPFEGKFLSYIRLEPFDTTSSKVVMGMSDSMKFPQTVISFIVNDCFGNRKKIESDIDSSLQNLKLELEKL
jgi:hypothetical protein